MQSNILEFVKKYFYNDINKVIIIDIDHRKKYELKDMSLSKIMSYDMNNIDGIIFGDDKIYMKF